MSILDQVTAPEPVDFRRAGRGVPLVMNDQGKFERYRRSSSVGKILDDESGLTDWRIRTIIVGAAQRPDLMAHVSTLDPDGQKGDLRDVAEECLVAGKGTQRRTTGTAIHKMLDLVDSDADWTPAPQFQAAVDSYKAALRNYGLVPVDIEVQCVNDEHRLAGTADRRYRTTKALTVPSTGQIIPIGETLIGDTKTGQSLEYAAGSYATQLAAYAGSKRYDVVTNERSEFDPPNNQDFGIIMHVDAEAGRTDVYFVDLEAGRFGIRLAESIREWRRRGDLITPAPVPLHLVPSRTAALMRDVEASKARHPSGGPRAVAPAAEAPTPAPEADRPSQGDTEAFRAWLVCRIDALRTLPTGRAVDALLRAWPAGVPGLKHPGHDMAQLDAISEALWAVEKEFDMPFPDADPRIHHEARESYADRWLRERRERLVDRWFAEANVLVTDNEVHKAITTFAVTQSDEWSDDDLTTMLDGTIRALGHPGGLNRLDQVTNADAPFILSSAMAMSAGTAMLLYGEDGMPVVRTNIQ